MKQTQININDTEKLAAYLKEVQKTFRVNVVGVQEVQLLAARAERALTDLKLLKKERKGAQAAWHAAGPAMAYRYQQGTTMITVHRGVKSWFLVKVERVQVYPKQKTFFDLQLTEAQDASARTALRVSYSVLA